jgi:hypothetical protein
VIPSIPTNNSNNNNNTNNIDKTKLIGWWYPDQAVINGTFYTPKRIYFGQDSTFIADLSNLNQGQYSGKWYWVNDSVFFTKIQFNGTESSSNTIVKKLTADSLHGTQNPPNVFVKSHR